MFAIAGQSTEPNWLNFFEGTHGASGVTNAKKNKILLSSKNFFFLNFDFFNFTGNAGHFS